MLLIANAVAMKGKFALAKKITNVAVKKNGAGNILKKYANAKMAKSVVAIIANVINKSGNSTLIL